MFAAVTSAALVGVEPRPVRVEVHVSHGKEKFAVVGLPDVAVREARERVRSAIVATGHRFPGRVTVNLAPADLPKVGSAYDLPIAIGVLVALGQIPAAASRGRPGTMRHRRSSAISAAADGSASATVAIPAHESSARRITRRAARPRRKPA